MKHSSAYEETDEFDAESCRTAQTFNSFIRESLLLDLTEMRIPVYHSIVRSSFFMENARMTMEFDIFDFVRWSFLFCASQCFWNPFFSMFARIFHGMSYGFLLKTPCIFTWSWAAFNIFNPAPQNKKLNQIQKETVKRDGKQRNISKTLTYRTRHPAKISIQGFPVPYTVSGTYRSQWCQFLQGASHKCKRYTPPWHRLQQAHSNLGTLILFISCTWKI